MLTSDSPRSPAFPNVPGFDDIDAMPDATVAWFPVFTLLLGYALKAFTDWLQRRRASKRERESRGAALSGHLLERRTAFQRETLLDLQDAMMQLMRTTGVINVEDSVAFRESGLWHKEPLGDELSENHRLASARATMLAVRVHDDAVRNLVIAVQRHVDSVVVAESEGESDQGVDAAMVEFDKLNQRIGEILRQLDDETASVQRRQRQ
jgi:hypothetical protein